MRTLNSFEDACNADSYRKPPPTLSARRDRTQSQPSTEAAEVRILLEDQGSASDLYSAPLTSSSHRSGRISGKSEATNTLCLGSVLAYLTRLVALSVQGVPTVARWLSWWFAVASSVDSMTYLRANPAKARSAAPLFQMAVAPGARGHAEA